MNFYLKNHTIYNSKVNKDLVILCFSDLHVDKSFNFNLLKSFVETANSISPHMICFAGDLANEASVFEDKYVRKALVDFFYSLSFIATVYIVRGNHDCLTNVDGKWKSFNSDSFFESLNNISNVHTLFNESLSTNIPNVSISGQDIGNDTYQYYHFYYESMEAYFYYVSPYIVDLERNVDVNDFNILTIHSPINAFIREFSNFSLVVSGHMHNGALPNCLDKLLPGNFGLIYPRDKIKLFPRLARGMVSLEQDAYGVICPPMNMSQKYSNNCLVKKLYKPGMTTINVKRDL